MPLARPWYHPRALPEGKTNLPYRETSLLCAPMVRGTRTAHDRRMQKHRTFIRLAASALAIATSGLAGCGSSAAKTAAPAPTTTTPPSAADTPYCDTALRWQVHELAPVDDSSPTAMKQWAQDYAAYVKTAAGQAPPAIRADWARSRRGVEHTFLPLLEKYGYSMARLQTQGSTAEKALLDRPPPPIARAQDHIHAYDGTVCAATRPEPADLTFKGPAPKRYCALVAADNRAADKVRTDGMQPEAIRALLTSRAYRARQRGFAEVAPNEISDDVATVLRFDAEQWDPLVARNGYDVQRLLLDGTPAERAILNYRSPAVSTASARVEAYDQQLCPGEAAE